MKDIWNAVKSIFVNDAHEIISERGKEILAEQQHQREMKREMKQTAVDWFSNQSYELFEQYSEGKFDRRTLNSSILSSTDKAKDMEKEQNKITENTSDGYHTFKELYEFRKVYNAALFNEWAKQEMRNPKWANGNEPLNLPKYNVHKSWRHNDGELCFGGGWFIVVAVLPTGQISNHYEAKDWDLFKIPETEKALFEFDGHTSQDVLDRLISTYGGNK
jgi:hypothetical protein